MSNNPQTPEVDDPRVLPPATHATDAEALAEARATNQRLNREKQRLESELATYRRAVADWEISERGTYVPLRTLAAIAKAAGLEVPARWELHYERVERAEAELRRMADEAQQQPDTETRDALMRAHVALAEQAGQDQAILARVRRLYESGPLGTCCAHLVGAALGAARQDGACTNCQGSGLDPRYNGESVCPDCTTAAERQDGAQTQEADRWGVCGDCGAAAGPDCDCPPSSEEQPVPGPGRVADEEQGETGCGPAPDQCDAESGEPCANHEREAAHAEGEHCFCGPECEAPQ